MNAYNMSAENKRKKKEKVVGFALDGVLRNISRSLDSVYKKCFPNRAVKLPVSPYNILDSYHFESQEEFANFLTSEAPTVFGRAEETYHGIVHDFNKVCTVLKANGYKPVLISKEVGKTKPGTLFFLSFTGCEVEDIRFVSKLEDFWEGVDILVTANPEVIALRPARKRAIKVHRAYNRDVKHVRRINNIKDLPKLLNIVDQKALPVVPTAAEVQAGEEFLIKKLGAEMGQKVETAAEPILLDVDTSHMDVNVTTEVGTVATEAEEEITDTTQG